MHASINRATLDIGNAWRLFGTKPLPEQMVAYCELHNKKHISMKNYLDLMIFIEENASKLQR